MTSKTTGRALSTVSATVEAEVGNAMYLIQYGGEVTEGEYKGTLFGSTVAGGMPVVYVHKDGKSIGSFALKAQSLIQAAINAVEEQQS